MPMILNVAGQVNQIKLSPSKALWPLFETIINSIQSLEESDIKDKSIIIDAVRPEYNKQRMGDKQGEITEELTHFISFIVTDNGNGFNTNNYSSFMEAYSRLKVKKGCKGIGRFLWLKAFEKVIIQSTYYENDKWHERKFDFTLNDVKPTQNDIELDTKEVEQKTIVTLDGFMNPYRDSVACSLESLAKKIIEHCLPYFITGQCPHILLQDNRGNSFDLNNYYEKTYKDSLHRDQMELKGKNYTLYHMLLSEGADKHELHLCANNREVKSFSLSNDIPNMQKKIISDSGSFYYVGYLTGSYLDEAVTPERSDFNFAESQLSDNIGETEIVQAAEEFIKAYLNEDLAKIAGAKKTQIDMLVKCKRPQYRLLLNRHPEIYDIIPAGLPEDKLDLELYKHQQKWELDTTKKKHDIEEKVKQDATSDIEFKKLFDDYCENISELNRASLAEYVIHRKAVIDLLEQALEVKDNGKYSKEERIHSIICPMQTTSNDNELDKMNLWLIDDRLAYHHFLASDKTISSIPLLENGIEKRMDLVIFDAALSYTADPENINSITIVELKRPMRNDGENDPVWQVLKYVRDIRSGNIKKANGRNFGDMSRVSFYCYVIGDLTQSMRDSAEGRGLTETQDKEGYFGFNPTFGAYVEVISYDKMLKDAKQRNRSLFDKLFEAKAKELVHPELLGN